MAAPAGEEAGGVGAPHPAPHAAAALHAPIAAAAAAATTGAPAARGAAAGVTPPALDPDIAMDHPANQPECADEFGPAPAVAEDDRDDPDNENGGGDNADGTGGGEAKDNGFVVEYCKDCGWECNIAPYKHKSKNNRNCPQRAEEEGYKGRWEYGSKAPNDYVYVHHPITPATVRQKPSDRLFTAREWKANEDAAGEFTPEPCTAPERTTLTDELKARFNSRTEPKELYLFVSGKAKISATGPEMPIHESMATWTRHWEESNYASRVCKKYQGPTTVKRTDEDGATGRY